MGPTAIGTATGAAALTVGRGVLSAAAGGLSFIAELTKAAAGTAIDETTKSAAATNQTLANLVAQLQQRIKQHLSAAGIHLTQSLELASDGAGGIAVLGPHPEQIAIEAALSSDLLLERDFHHLASQSPDFKLTIQP